jgi:putative transcriptional regulator
LGGLSRQNLRSIIGLSGANTKIGGAMPKKRSLFRELAKGIQAMKAHREGKITLRSYKIEPAPLPKVDSRLIRDTRKKLRCSRAVFARKLRINERTLEKWEQGRAKPNPQAAALVLLVRQFPDTLDRLDRIAAA